MKTTFALAVFGAALAAAGSAHAQQQTRLGSLECNVAPGVGMIITSSKALDCVLFRNDGRPAERYVGTIRKFGVDLGATGAGRLDWWVASATTRPGPGSLAGDYAGVGGSATVGIGAGANVMVGGNANSTSLQPLSAQVQTGVNVAAGVSSLSLEYVPGKAQRKRRHARH